MGLDKGFCRIEFMVECKVPSYMYFQSAYHWADLEGVDWKGMVSVVNH